MDLDAVLNAVRVELEKAMRKHGPMRSPHEGYAVIQEEVDELWDRVKRDEGCTPGSVHEAIQVAAMGLRYVLDVCGDVDMAEAEAIPSVERKANYAILGGAPAPVDLDGAPMDLCDCEFCAASHAPLENGDFL
jgi:hypothetical protein